MEVESQVDDQEVVLDKKNKLLKRLLLFINCLLLAIGACGGPLVVRLYFVHGGARIWLACWLEMAGFPMLFFPLVLSYFQRCKHDTVAKKAKPFLITCPLFAGSALLGLVIGAANYAYSFGSSRLPVSTSTLLLSTQLAFTAGFAYFMVKQKFTSYSVNAVLLLCVSAVLLGLHSSSDRPANVTNREYFIGFLALIATAIAAGFSLPATELMYKKAKREITYTLVMEMQGVMSLFATALCTVGMLANKDFQAISREAKIFAIGEAKYYLVLVANAIVWQFYFLGAVGVVFTASSLFSGIMISTLLPITEVLGVIFYKESFSSEKGVALGLSIWGAASYFYGEYKQSKVVVLTSKTLPEQDQEKPGVCNDAI